MSVPVVVSVPVSVVVVVSVPVSVVVVVSVPVSVVIVVSVPVSVVLAVVVEQPQDVENCEDVEISNSPSPSTSPVSVKSMIFSGQFSCETINTLEQVMNSHTFPKQLR